MLLIVVKKYVFVLGTLLTFLLNQITLLNLKVSFVLANVLTIPTQDGSQSLIIDMTLVET